MAERYFKDNRDYKTDLQDYLAYIKNRPPKTIRLNLSAVRTFLLENDVELPQRFWRSLNRRIKGGTLTVDKIPSNVELRRIIMHMPVHGKALYLTLASSGMRIGETLQLKLDDINLDVDPPKISIRGEYTKSGDKRIAFISTEAKEHVMEWLKVRTEYLRTSAKRSWKHKKSLEDKRLFPFGDSTANFIWNNALDKAQLNHRDSSTNRHKFHSHVLRKFFRTRMGNVISVDVTEALMGHKGYLTEVYRKHTEEDLAKFYKQGEASVIIFGRVEEIAGLRKEVEDRNKQLQTLVNGLTSDNMELKQKVGSLETTLTELQGALDQKVENIARHVFLELRGSTEDVKQAQKEFTKRYRKEVKQKPKVKQEEKPEEEKEIPQKTSKIDSYEQYKQDTEEQEKPKQKKTWREEIYGETD